MQLKNTNGYNVILKWMKEKNELPFKFQEQTWQRILDGYSGIVNAPTGCGKTFSVFLGLLIRHINQNKYYQRAAPDGLQLIWVTPLRALAKDICRAMEEVAGELGIPWRIGIRNGDTSTAIRQQQKKNPPQVLIITPESLHLLLAQRHYADFFEPLKMIVVDEWHELLGSKRGVQTELALSRLVGLTSDPEKRSPLQIWGISATIGNLEQAKDVLLSPLKINTSHVSTVVVTADIKKHVSIQSIYPDEIEKYPWAGHLGLKLMDKVLPIIRSSKTTLMFINTRGMSEVWYQSILRSYPEMAGSIALHHGSIDRELRDWIEENLHTGRLKLVICTSSLDLGVDFRPVETIIQVGSPKGVARFLQRAGRSGHGPGETSHIYFLPTHSPELVEAAALKDAMKSGLIESKEPLLLCFDVLLQYLTTLAVSDGFDDDKIFREVTATFCYRTINREEFNDCIRLLTSGGEALGEYDDYKKMEKTGTGYQVTNRRIAMRHRMQIGTIVSEPMMRVKLIGGGFIGVIEEHFISMLSEGDVFSLAGKTLELVRTKDMEAIVRKSKAKKSIIPSWLGGRMPLSSSLSHLLRVQIDKVNRQCLQKKDEELQELQPLFELQSVLSHIPAKDELLIEKITTEDGFHLFVYPFEGRLVHEAMASITAYRLSRFSSVSFSMAMNDYGFELLSDQPIPLDENNAYRIFSSQNLLTDIQGSLNSVELAKRKFRDIATIGGLIFQGYPGKNKKARHLQASAGLIFNVLSTYDAGNLLIRQSYQEALDQQMEEHRLRQTLERIHDGKIVITHPQQLTPFCFPIKVDSLRETLSSEKLEDRIRKMYLVN